MHECKNGESDPGRKKRKKETDKSEDSNYKSRLRDRSSIRRTQKSDESQCSYERVPKKRVVLEDTRKLGRSGFMKKTSSVGTEFQVSIIPTAGTYLSPTNERSET